jgi:hypothetical protein
LLSRREPWRILQGQSIEGINVSPPLHDFLTKVVANEPSRRFSNASAARDALEAATRGERTDIERARERRSNKWLRPLALAAAGLAVAAGGYGVHALLSNDPPAELRAAVNEMAVTQMKTFADEMCGCETEACAQRIMAKHERWSAELSRIPDAYATAYTTQSMVALNQKYHSCIALASAKEAAKREGRPMPLTFDFTGPPDAKRYDFSAKPVAKDSLPAGRPVDLDFKGMSLHDVLRVISESCGLNIVAPDNIDAKITLNLKKAPCDQALEVLLESHGLWYRYRKAGNILLVAPRGALDREAEAQLARDRANIVDDQLPLGPDLDLDFKNAPLHDLMRIFADMAKVNVIIPDHLMVKVTVKLTKTPWGVALRTILESHGLWYRYRPNGKLLRIAPRVELDREDEAARARARVGSPAPANHTDDGALTVQSKPRAAIWIDGKDTELTTPATLKLPAGKHKLMLVVDKNKYTYPVDIKTGEKTLVVKDYSHETR